jgi:hypothetical protein
MNSKILAGAVIVAVALATAACQTRTGTGAAAGAATGAVVGGPVGAAVGGGVGAAVGLLSEANEPRFRTYVVSQMRPSHTHQGEIVVGTVLPSTGITYYEIPAEYGVIRYRYTVVNNRTVLVDPQTHRIVQIIS